MRSFVNFKALLIRLSEPVKRSSSTTIQQSSSMEKLLKQGRSDLLSGSLSSYPTVSQARDRDFWRAEADSSLDRSKIWLSSPSCAWSVGWWFQTIPWIHPDFLHNEGHTHSDRTTATGVQLTRDTMVKLLFPLEGNLQRIQPMRLKVFPERCNSSSPYLSEPAAWKSLRSREFLIPSEIAIYWPQGFWGGSAIIKINRNGEMKTRDGNNQSIHDCYDCSESPPVATITPFSSRCQK